MISVEINGLKVSGTDQTDFEYALTQVAAVAALAREHGFAMPPRTVVNGSRTPVKSVASVGSAEGEEEGAEGLGDGIDWTARYCEHFQAGKFRIARCETERFAHLGDQELIRQAAAKQRLEYDSIKPLSDEELESAEACGSVGGMREEGAAKEGHRYTGGLDLGEVNGDIEF